MSERIYPPREALSTFHAGMTIELFALQSDPKTGDVVSIEFWEKQADPTEVRRLKRASWEYAVPEGVAVLHAPESGLGRDAAKVFWASWIHDGKLFALSLFQEDPLRADLEPTDRLVFAPIITASKKLQQYVWREDGSQWSLLGMEFEGEFGTPGKVASQGFLTVGMEPLHSTAASVPGATDDRTAVCWLEDGGRDEEGRPLLYAAGTFFPSAGGGPLRSEVVAGVRALPPAQLGVNVDPEGRLMSACVVEGEDGAYGVLRTEFRFDDGTVSIERSPLPLEPSTVHSAAVVYYKDPEEERGAVILLTESGDLIKASLDGTDLRTIRDDVDPSYTFPFLSTYTGIYEARFSGNGDVTLEAFD